MSVLAKDRNFSIWKNIFFSVEWNLTPQNVNTNLLADLYYTANHNIF